MPFQLQVLYVVVKTLSLLVDYVERGLANGARMYSLIVGARTLPIHTFALAIHHTLSSSRFHTQVDFVRPVCLPEAAFVYKTESPREGHAVEEKVILSGLTMFELVILTFVGNFCDAFLFSGKCIGWYSCVIYL